ncbi:MAG TPA: acetate/propionate family kinase [Gaiellaceae bacterium]
MPGLDARARRGPARCPGLGLAVLVVNAGSTSLKLHLVEGDESRAVDSFAVACDAVGHRVVHGGTRFREPVLVDEEVISAIEQLMPLAPLHNAPALRALEEAQKALPEAPHVAVFDTAFHATLPEEATRYAVPERWHEWGVRRYGFHGLSVEWAASQVKVPRLVVCHLGGGSSVTAVLDGRSVETTMGFSPLEGVPMTTRSGSVDPGALLYLLRERGLSVDELDHALEHESGLAGLSGTSGDVRELADDSVALAVYVQRVAAAVAASAAALGGLDAIAFTGGIGEHSALVRERVCGRLRFLGAFAVHVVEAHEELVIARAVRAALGP